MYDKFNRNIRYLRISVTDRCNLRCRYCMPAEGVKTIPHQEVLRFEEIVEVVERAVDLGFDKFRITGGEPLVRKGIVDLVAMIANVQGVKDLSMTTNGQLLEAMALPLKEAGLHRVNISLDTLDAARYAYITRGGSVDSVLKGIEAAQLAGFAPIKINCVLNETTIPGDKEELKAFCDHNNLQLRFIHEMKLETGVFYPVEGGKGGVCALCDRIRLTANGDLVPCLMSDMGYNIRELGVESALLQAIGDKPKTGHHNKRNAFYNIGG